MIKKVKINTDWCIWCWACIINCPKIFKFNDDWKAFVKKQPENNEEFNCSQQAINICPVKVIHIIEEK